MTTTRDPTDDIFDEESDVNFGDKEWNRLKESLTKVHIYHNSRYIRCGSEIYSVLTINDRPVNFEMFRRRWSLISFILFQY